MTTLIEQANALTTPRPEHHIDNAEAHERINRLTELCRALAGKLEEAEKIIERLPKDCEGNPVIDGDNRFVDIDGRIEQVTALTFMYPTDHERSEPEVNFWAPDFSRSFGTDVCHPTRETVLSAKGGDDA
jgi:hypothetical protein